MPIAKIAKIAKVAKVAKVAKLDHRRSFPQCRARWARALPPRPGRPMRPGRPGRLARLACLACLLYLPFIGCRGGNLDIFAAGQRPAQEFREDWESVPRLFRGDDFMALARALGAEKGEFESRAAYAEKIKEIAERKGKYVFLVDPGKEGLHNFDVVYNPNIEQFRISVSINWNSSMLMALTESSVDAYMSPNAFGGRTRIVDMAIDKYFMRLLNESLDAVAPTDRTIFEGGLKYPSSHAQVFKGRVKLLLVAALVPGRAGADGAYAKALDGNLYYDREFHLTDATAAHPVNLNEYSHYLYAKLDSIWVYDELTGAVLGKHSVAKNDEYVRQARQALADGKYYTAQALVSRLPDSNPVAQKVKEEIEAMRLDNAEEENRRLARDRKNERLRNYGPEPDPAVLKRFIQRLVLVLIDAPSEILTISQPMKALATVDGELRASWQVRVEVRNKREQLTNHLYLYIKHDEIIGYELM
jgi:hypothetical protein